MDSKDELWRTLRCAGKAQDKAAVETLMLRYRPIAPKPTTGQPCVGDNSNSYGTSKRSKRKYVRVSKNNKNSYRRKGRSEASDQENDQYVAGDIVTLQLLPEKSDLNDESTPLDSDNLDPTKTTITAEKTLSGTWIVVDDGAPEDPTEGMGRRTEVETWVTVESVTGACDNGGSSSHALGCTDVEIVETLEKDTYPGFISDGSNRVLWVNEAYRRAMTGNYDGDGESPEVVVWLVTEGTTAFHEYQSFTCWVRLQYTWQETRYTKTVPCDVWKMEFGGFAWRLDTKAALALWL